VGAALRDPNGPVNWPEFGNPNTEASFKALVGMSAYQKVQDGTSFPAVMLYHGWPRRRFGTGIGQRPTCRHHQLHVLAVRDGGLDAAAKWKRLSAADGLTLPCT